MLILDRSLYCLSTGWYLPITTLITAWREFSACPSVSDVVIKWKGTQEELGYDDIAGMDGQFDPLPETTETTPTADDKTDAEVLYDAIQAVDKKVDALDAKLAHLINVGERTYSLVNDGDEPVPTSPAAAGSSNAPHDPPDAATERVSNKRRKRAA
jgi:hypothetical protein